MKCEILLTLNFHPQKVIMNIISYLKQPFPKEENKWTNIVAISVFVALFLFIFQPFGIDGIETGTGKYIFIGGFGLVTFIILIVYLIIIERLFFRFFREKSWSLYKELFWLFIVIFSIGMGNVFYTTLFFDSHLELTLGYVLSYQLLTFAVAVFPFSVFVIMKHNHLLKKHTASANDVNNSLKIESKHGEHNKHICLYSYNEKKKIEFDINDLYFIESKGNDVELYLREDDHIVSKTLRNTLKKSLEYLVDSAEIVQCHRAYLVNVNKVNRAEGNSQGLVLKLVNCDVDVPVSRGFVAAIKMKIV